MKKTISLFLVVFFLLSLGNNIFAIECEGDPPVGDVGQLQEYQDKCEEKVKQLQGEAKTLKSAISLITSKINLTTAQIRSTNSQIIQLEEEINSLGVVITDLNAQLDQLAKVYVQRIRESYKGRKPSVITLFFSSDSFTTFQNKLKYLRIAQKRDEIILKELESARLSYDEQKTTKEEKQAEIEALRLTLESQKKVLGVQQSQKNQLLSETQSNEKLYQERLAKAVAELAAIESIIAGRGSETQVRTISTGEHIASIIPGPSACSTGAHLHFEVVNNKVHQNPSNYLKSISPIWNNSPDGAFSFTGSWDWPLNDPIRITQGYGHTAYSTRYANDVHTGIDMTSNSGYEVKAVQSGTLYRGSIACGGGTLKYVRVKHQNDGLDTFYLHVNYF